MSRKEEYKEKNLLYLDEIASEEGTRTLPCGILYKVIQAGTGKVSPNREIVVSGKFEEIGAIAARILLNIYQSAVCEYRLCLFRHAPNVASDHERGFEQTPCGEM